jgi:diacylglycerol kinase family enzyme
MKIRLVMNPGSRSGRGRRLWPVWEAGLRRAGIPFECATTTGPGHAFRLSRESQDGDTLVAVGGDGTINEVLDGIVQSGRAGIRMGVLYSGTSPDFCRFHGIPTDPEPAIRGLVEGKARQVDVVRIEHSDGNGGRQVAHFGCSCNVGLGAAVARWANRWRPRVGDGAGTGMAVVRAILFSRPVDLDLAVDGTDHALSQVNNLSVLKNPHIASGLKLNTERRPDDGRLTLVAVHGQSRLGLCALLPGFYSGRASGAKALFVTECSRVSIRSAGEPAPEIEFDGDPRGRLPADIRIVPRALQLIGGAHE